jgi:hypothetical protein
VAKRKSSVLKLKSNMKAKAPTLIKLAHFKYNVILHAFQIGMDGGITMSLWLLNKI